MKKNIYLLLISVLFTGLNVYAVECDPCSADAVTPSSGGSCVSVNFADDCFASSLSSSGVYGTACGCKSAGVYYTTQNSTWIKVTVPASGEFSMTLFNQNDLLTSTPKARLFTGTCGSLIFDDCAWIAPIGCPGGCACGTSGTVLGQNDPAYYGNGLQIAQTDLTPGDDIWINIDMGDLSAGTGTTEMCFYDNVIDENGFSNSSELCDGPIDGTTLGSIQGLSCGTKPANCGGGPAPSFENMSFYHVSANSAGDDITISVTGTTCEGSNYGVQVLIYENNGYCDFSTCVTGATASGTGDKVFDIISPTPNGTYTVVIDGFAGALCDFTIEASTCILTPVSINFIDFDITEKKGLNILQWLVSMDEDFSHFEVMKSLDGKKYESIGEVNPSKESTYGGFSYRDEQTNENAYYKIKAIDYDGIYTYSRSILIAGGNEIHQTKINDIYYSNNMLNVSISSSVDESIELMVYGIDGKILESITYDNFIGVKNEKINIPFINGGMYFVALKQNGIVITKRFTVAK